MFPLKGYIYRIGKIYKLYVLKDEKKFQFKGTDRLFKVVELSMQCCGKLHNTAHSF